MPAKAKAKSKRKAPSSTSEPQSSKCQKSTSPPAIHRTKSGHAAEFVSDVSDSFNCEICLELLDDPRQCLEGHLFCLECVMGWLNRHPDNQSCPTCRTPMSQETLGRNLAIANMIRQLEVKCANSSTDGDGGSSSCEWRGPLERFEAHCAAECGDVLVDCPNSARGCDEKLHRKDREVHLLECPHELVACAECSGEIERGVMDRHLRDECLAVEVVCVHGCGVSHARHDAALHAEGCPEVLMACPYAECGCAVVGLRRKDYAAHQEASVVRHMELMQTQMRRENDQLKQALAICTQVKVSWTCELKEANQYSKRRKFYLNGYGEYEVYLSARRLKNSLAVFVEATGGHYPVGVGGTELACGDTQKTLSAKAKIDKGGSGVGYPSFMRWARAEALAVNGKIIITAIIKLSIPEGAKPIKV